MSPERTVPFVVLIPAYRPSASLLEVVLGLSQRAVPAIVVVDDGSGPEYRDVFAAVAAVPGVQVIRHAINLGKGAALKTGINHALCAFPYLSGIVTADADGQHHPADVEAVAQALMATPDALVLGTRSFGAGVPLRSRFGNIATRGIMHALLGRKLADTQTGLRGIPSSLLARLLKLESTGYEFEFEMLIAAHQLALPILELPVQTIYEQGNRSSHFNPLIDSMKIYFVLLRFGSISLMTALLDNLVFYLAYRRTGDVLSSQVLGRILAVIFNYSMVRASVFYSREQHLATLPKYLALVLASGAVSYGGIRYLSIAAGMNPVAAKLLVETLLFFVNFAVQRFFIFKPRDDQKRGELETTSDDTIQPQRGPAVFWALAVGIVLAACVAAEVYGFSTSHLFAQQIWEPAGWKRLSKYTWVFLGAGLPILLMVPRAFAGIVCALLAVLTAIAVGPGALLAPAFFLISANTLGSIFLGRTKEDGIKVQICATLLGASVYIFLMTFLARLPVNYAALWIAILAGPIAFDLRGTLRRLRSWVSWCGSVRLRRPAQRAAFALLVYVLILHWFVALKPEVSADGLAMHLAIAADIDYHHALTFEPARVLWSVMPMGADFAYSIVYLLGGEQASRLLNFAMLLTVVALLYTAMRKWVTPAVACLLAALFAATPLVQMVTGDLFVENQLAALILGMMTAIWLLGETGERRFLLLAAVLGGSALATKFGALAFVAMAAPFAIAEAWRHRGRLGRAPALAAAVFFLTALPPYAIAFAKTGNPLFPFLNDKFHSPLLAANPDIRDARFHHPLAWDTLYGMTFQTSRWYEGQDGSFGFQYLPFALLALVAIAIAGRPAAGAAIVALGASYLIVREQGNLRYVYAALPLVTVCYAALVGAMAHRRGLFRAMIAVACIATAMDVYFLPASSFYHKELYLSPLLWRAGRERYLARGAPIRGVIDHFNRAHAGEAVLLPGGDAAIAGIHGDVYENVWHQFTIQDRIRHAGTLEEMKRLMREWKIRTFILHKPGPDAVIQPPALRELIENCTEPDFEYGDYYEARSLDNCRGVE